MSPEPVPDTILDEEITSIKETRERAFFLCGNGKKVVMNTEGPRDKARFYLFKDDMKKSCGNTPVTIFHTHGVGTGLPSYTDWETYKKHHDRFPMVTGHCSIGVDGMFCVGRDGDLQRVPMTPARERRMLAETGLKKFSGHAVFCDKIVGDGKEKFSCTIQTGLDTERPAGKFTEVSMSGGIVWNGDKDADVSMFSPFHDKEIECYADVTGTGKRMTCHLPP
jgi:proteasome lid subunit RPN8/RPN11